MAQINLNADPSAIGVVQIMPVSDPTVAGVIQANINTDPTTAGVTQANINYDPTTPGLVFVNFDSSAPAGGFNPSELSAVQFSPQQYANAGAVLQYASTQPWTAMALIKVPGTPQIGTTAAAVIFTYSNAGGAYTGYEFWIDTSGFLRVRIISNFGTSNYIGAVGSVIVTDGNWHLVGATYSGTGLYSGIHLYEDGVVDAGQTSEGTSLSGSSTPSTSLFIGNQGQFLDTFALNGSLGHFSISNVARSSGYMSTYTKSSLPPINSSMKLYYGFTEGSGTTLHDKSASGFNATLEQTPYWGPGQAISIPASTAAFDAIASNTGSNLSSIACTITTAGTNELVVVFCICVGAAPSIADTAGLTWVPRKVGVSANTDYGYAWVALAPSKLTSDVITVTGSSDLDLIAAVAYKNISSVPLPQAPIQNTDTVAGQGNLIVNANYSSGLMVAFIAFNFASPTAGAGWNSRFATDFTLIQDKTFSAPVSNLTVPMGSGSGDQTGGYLEVII